MANYCIIQTNDETHAYAFKVVFDGFRPEEALLQREQRTLTGALDVQAAPADQVLNYTVKVYGDESGTFNVTAGAIMTATTITWGDYDNLKALFHTTVPPSNKFRFRDFDGTECYVFFSGRLTPRHLTPMPTGGEAYVDVAITLKKSAV